MESREHYELVRCEHCAKLQLIYVESNELSHTCGACGQTLSAEDWYTLAVINCGDIFRDDLEINKGVSCE